MRRSKRAASAARRLARLASSSGRRRTGSVPGQVYFSIEEFMNEIRMPLRSKSAAAARASSLGRNEYSLPPGTLRSSRNSSLYCLAKSMEDCGVRPISSVMALMLERSILALAGRTGAANAPAAAPKRSRRVINWNDNAARGGCWILDVGGPGFWGCYGFEWLGGWVFFFYQFGLPNGFI